MTSTKTAFVAMQFAGDPWRDQRYQVIREVALEAGYSPLRADEIKTSGPVLDEVCKQLREADLVVIDTSGDSQSVSYEIGYAHGCGRSDATVLLLRQKEEPTLPFNYQHFRHRMYADLRHLRRLLREWFSLSTPMTDDQTGRVFVFRVPPGVDFYGASVARAFLHVLKETRFSGRCEYYASESLPIPDWTYRVALGMKRSATSTKSAVSEWKKLEAQVAHRLSSEGIVLDGMLSEFSEMRNIRQCNLRRGVVEFADGLPIRVIDPEQSENDSWWVSEIRLRTETVNHDAETQSAG